MRCRCDNCDKDGHASSRYFCNLVHLQKRWNETRSTQPRIQLVVREPEETAEGVLASDVDLFQNPTVGVSKACGKFLPKQACKFWITIIDEVSGQSGQKYPIVQEQSGSLFCSSFGFRLQ